MKYTLVIIALLTLVIADFVLAGGCGLFADDEDTTALQLRMKANDMRTELNDISDAARNAFVTATAACAYSDRIPSLKPVCSKLGPSWRALNAAWLAAWSAVDVYEDGLITLESVQAAIGRVRDVAGEFGELLEVSDAEMDRGVSEGGGSAPAPAQAGPDPATEGATTPAGP